MRIAVVPILLVALAGSSAVFASDASPQPDADPSRAPQKRIALTFDDAPRGDGPRFSGDRRATALIETLRAAGTGPVAFFVTTRHLPDPGGRERIERYARAGHLIANHTHTHPWLSRTDTAEYLAGIDRAEELLQGLPNRRAWFRFPYLDEGTPREKRDAVRAGLTERGLFNGYVTVDNYDWYLEHEWKQAEARGCRVHLDGLRDVYVKLLVDATEFYDAIAIDALGRSPAHVLLLHENDVGALFVDDLVAALRDKGWKIVSPDEAYADPVAKRIPTTLKTRQGHIGALAVEAGLDPRKLTHWSIDEAQIDAVLDQRGVFDSCEDESTESARTQ